MFKLLVVILLSAVIAGCGTFRSNEAAWTLGVTYAIQRYVYEKPEDKREATKERIRAIARDLKALASNDAVTLPLLRQALDVYLEGADLIPPDRMLAAGIADAIVLELRKRIGDGLIKPDQLFEVIQVLELIERAAV